MKHRSVNTCLVLAFSLSLAACGSGDGKHNTISSSDVSIRFSDAPVEKASSVTITVDSLTFRHSDEAIGDIVVEDFTSKELNLIGASTFTIDLLDVQGEANMMVMDSVVLPVGDYTDLRIGVDNDSGQSYVLETEGGNPKLIKVPSGELKLGSFTVGENTKQSFVIEFGLRQSLTYNPGPDRYILKPHGVRIVNLDQAASIVGTLDTTAMAEEEYGICNPDSVDNTSNRVYLYSNEDQPSGPLADAFDPNTNDVSETPMREPVATAPIIDGYYRLSYITPGTYTLAISCGAAEDDPDLLDDITIPNPVNASIEFTIYPDQTLQCNFLPRDTGCTPESSDETEVTSEVDSVPTE